MAMDADVFPKYVCIRKLYLLVIMDSTQSHLWWGRTCDENNLPLKVCSESK